MYLFIDNGIINMDRVDTIESNGSLLSIYHSNIYTKISFRNNTESSKMLENIKKAILDKQPVVII